MNIILTHHNFHNKTNFQVQLFMVCLHPLDPPLYSILHNLRYFFTLLSVILSIITTVIIVSCKTQSSKNYSILLILIVVSITAILKKMSSCILDCIYSERLVSPTDIWSNIFLSSALHNKVVIIQKMLLEFHANCRDNPLINGW